MFKWVIYANRNRNNKVLVEHYSQLNVSHYSSEEFSFFCGRFSLNKGFDLGLVYVMKYPDASAVF